MKIDALPRENASSTRHHHFIAHSNLGFPIKSGTGKDETNGDIVVVVIVFVCKRGKQQTSVHFTFSPEKIYKNKRYENR